MRELWRADLDDDRPCYDGVVAGSVVVVASRPGLVGLDLETGQRRWELAVEVTALQQPVAAADGKLFVLSANPRRIQALDPETGEVIWSRSYSSGWPYAVAVVGGELVALAGSSVRIYGLDGEPRRSTTLKAAYPMTVTEAPGGDYLITGMKGQHSLFRVARESLEMQWSAKVTGGFSATQPATVSDDTAIFHQNARWLVAYDVATGEQRWRKKKAAGPGFCLALSDGDLLCGTSEAARTRLSDGKVAWAVPGVNRIQVLDGDRFVASSTTDGAHTLSLRSTATGDSLETLELRPRPSPDAENEGYLGLFLAAGPRLFTGLQWGVVTAVGLAD